MSRRKQQKPRHLDAEGDLPEALTQEDSSTVEEEEGVSSSEAGSNYHTCTTCQAHLSSYSQLTEHQKTCLPKFTMYETDKPSMEGLGPRQTAIEPEQHCSDADVDEDDVEDDIGLMDDDDDDVDEDGVSEEGYLPQSTHHGLEQSMDAEDETVDETEKTLQEGLNADGDVAGLPDSNVKIESLENTTVAVAQFAENNMTPSDLMMLQSTLYNLQQQQLFQLQLLQQLQQHIAMGTSPGQLANLPLPAFLPGVNPMVLHNMQKNLMAAAAAGQAGNLEAAAAALGLNQKLTASSADDGSRDTDSTTGNDSQDSTPSTPAPLCGHEGSADVIKTSPGTTQSVDGQTTSSLSTSNASLNGLTELVNMAQLSKDKQNQNDAKSGSESGSSQRPPYAADDPYFKYKCRFCHKVFGSDSALQIHIRSHTGERPFKCNICGNRFTTRGNLKVHFSRHKAQYPHIKMNPNPVPEHLDRLPLQPGVLPSQLGGMQVALPPPLMSTGAPPHQNMPPLIPMMPRPSAPDVKSSPDQSANSSQKDHEDRGSPSPKRRCSEEDRPGSSPRPKREPSPSMKSPVRTLVIQPTSMYGPPPLTSLPHTSIPAAPAMPMPSALPSPGTPSMMPPFGMEASPVFPRGSILPQKTEDPMEQYMEIQKSETSKLEALVKNIETKLTDPNQCAICHRILSCKSALQMHYRTHTGERPFKCKICGRAFTTKGNLKTHMGVHRAKPPMRMLHQCPVCHKQFTNAMVLQQHIRMHTGEAPKSMPLPMPMPNDMMMAAQAMGSVPFPGFPFFPPGMPGFPQQAPGVGGMDLRKHSMKQEADAGRDKDGDPRDGEEMTAGMYDGDEEGSRYSGDEEGMDDEDEFADQYDDEIKDSSEQERSMAKESNTPREAPVLAQQDCDKDIKSPYEGKIPSPPSLVPVKESSSPPDKEERRDYLSLYGEPSTASSQEGFPTNPYSTSLLALQERVDAIENMDVHSKYSLGRPLEQMEKIVQRTDDLRGHHSEGMGARSNAMSPRREEARSPVRSDSNASSESGRQSDGSQECRSNSQTPPNSTFPFVPFRGSDVSPRNYEGTNNSTTCDVCYKTFACKSALDIHYRSHTQDRPFQCDVCDRGFTTRGNLKQHLLTHKIRDLPDQAFNGDAPKNESSPNSESTPSSHSTYHSSSGSSSATTVTPPSSGENLKPKSPAQTPPSAAAASAASTPTSSSPFMRKPNLRHVCQVCQKPFSSASALQIHMRTHTGDKPFKCTVCGKAFTTKGNLKVHMSTHMWNNGPSRRGRRMSVEGIPGLPPKEREFFNAFAPRGPSELFPFPFPGMPPHGFPPKMNEISVIQSMNGATSHLPPTSAADAMLNHLHPMLKHPMMPGAEILRKTEALIKSEDEHKSKDVHEANNNSSKSDYPPSGTNGELDLSMRKSSPSTSLSPSASSGAHQTSTSPKMTPQHPESAANPGWLWKTTCHLCNKACSSTAALELHMKSHMQVGASPGQASPKPLLA